MNRRDALAILGGLALPAAARSEEERRGPAAVDAVFKDVLDKHGIVGGSVAVAKDGRLVMARGYGHVDAEARRPVTVDTLFCIASVTKAITALGILRLVDEGKAKLDARLLDLAPDVAPAGGKLADPRYKDVTVRQVLSHTAGIPNRLRGNEDDEDDEDGGSPAAALRTALSLPLDFAPGTQRRYSNSGFTIARLVIMRAGSAEYEPFVRDKVLAPAGVTRAVMEAADPVAGETGRFVRGPKGLRPAARNIANWLFTPTDLVKLLTAVHGSRGKPLLTKHAYHEMLAPPPPPLRTAAGEAHVGLGWDRAVAGPAGDGFSKNGGKPGVSAWAEQRPDGVAWAMMLNTTLRPEGNPPPAREVVRRVHQVLDAGPRWPSGDMFHG